MIANATNPTTPLLPSWSINEVILDTTSVPIKGTAPGYNNPATIPKAINIRPTSVSAPIHLFAAFKAFIVASLKKISNYT